jgi:hypothetical protein
MEVYGEVLVEKSGDLPHILFQGNRIWIDDVY